MVDKLNVCKLFLIFTLLSFANAQVKNGDEVELKDKPAYLVLLKIIRKNIHNSKSLSEGICGGIILNEFWVLTAAHCFDSIKYEPMNARKPNENVMRHDIGREITVVAGDVSEFSKLFSPLSTRQERAASYWLPHHEYDGDPWNYSSDIALVMVGKKFNFNDHVHPAVIAGIYEHLNKGDNCAVYGWGKRTEGGEAGTNRRLTRGSVKYLSSKQKYIEFGQTSNKHKEQASASGDSGGPLVCIGINGDSLVFGLIQSGDHR